MARSHVPKFGNWDGDNVPYTVYFENARKEKSNGVMINPNDPEQNPEAFNFREPIDSAPVREKPVAADTYVHQEKTYDEQKGSYSHKRVGSESSSGKSSSNYSLSSVNKLNHQRKGSDHNKYVHENNIMPSPGHHKLNSDDFSCRSVSVPKFGEWDENDPRSAEGYTVIFNKVKEEKHIAASKFPPLPPQTMDNYQTSHKKKTRSKKCCGLF